MTPHPEGTRPFTATVVLTGCPLTPGELRALARMLPELARVRTARRGGELSLQATLVDVDPHAAARRLRRAVPRLLTGFPGVVAAVTTGPAARTRAWPSWWRGPAHRVPSPRAAGG
ncbi:hypothetical protein [Pseudonocardia spirodelae]|uniref:Uncharacterized protein n=1 Tax=Pseudonocardia spirodelae TaxID=3133431 RepID=A0ABU8T1I2_9PSEU